MKLSKPQIPKEIDADVAMSVVIPHTKAATNLSLSFNYEFKGVSERTALGDNLGITVRNKQDATSTVKFSLKRDSLYHILPEYLFHSLDHYLGIVGDTEEFDKRYKEKEEQVNNALAYFKPFDQHYQELRTDYQQWLNKHVFQGNQFLSDFITEGYDVNLNNPFIKAVYPCIAWLRDYRGNSEMVKMALGYAFRGHAIVCQTCDVEANKFSDNIPSNIGGTLNNMFCGSSFKVKIYVWRVYYQTLIETSRKLEELLQQIKEFERFFSLWFLPLESRLIIDFGDKKAAPILSDSNKEQGSFLNYSTQLV